MPENMEQRNSSILAIYTTKSSNLAVTSDNYKC